MKTQKLSLASNSVLAILDQALTISLNIIITIMLARYLGAESLGEYALALTLVGFISIFANLGVNIPLARKVAQNRNKLSLYLGNVLFLKSFITLPLLLCLSWLIATALQYSDDVVFLAILIAIHNFFISLIGSLGVIFTSLHRNDCLLKVNLFSKAIQLITTYIMLSLSFNLVSLILAYIIISFAAFIYGILKMKAIIGILTLRFNKRLSTLLVFTSFPLILANAAEYLNLKVDTLYIGVLLDETAVGYYTAAYSIFIGASLVPLALTKVYFPNFVSKVTSNKQQARSFFYNYFFTFTLYSVIAGTGFYTLSKTITSIIYGEGFEPTSDVLAWLSVALIALVLNRLVNYSLLAIKENKYYFKITLYGLVVNLILNYFLINAYGIIGAVMATLMTESLVLILGYIKLQQHLREY